MASEGVAAVDRALSILDAFTESDQKLALAELAKRTGLYKSTLLRLAKTLEKFGYLIRSEDGSYHLGSKVLFLGSLYQRSFRTSEFVPPVLRQIVEELHEGASFYVRDEEQRVCLHRIDAHRAVRDSIHEGDRLPLTVGAAGHVILAFNRRTGARYDEIRKNMYAASFGERDPETAAIACPVFGLDQKFVGALSVSGPRYRIEELGVKRVLPVLFKHAHALTRTLGGDPAVPDFATWLGREPVRSDTKAAKKYAKPSRRATVRATAH
jgi:DNA-binding IclR family transcriptional regulator